MNTKRKNKVYLVEQQQRQQRLQDEAADRPSPSCFDSSRRATWPWGNCPCWRSTREHGWPRCVWPAATSNLRPWIQLPRTPTWRGRYAVGIVVVVGRHSSGRLVCCNWFVDYRCCLRNVMSCCCWQPRANSSMAWTDYLLLSANLRDTTASLFLHFPHCLTLLLFYSPRVLSLRCSPVFPFLDFPLLEFRKLWFKRK